MRAVDLWRVLAASSPNARVVLRTEGGDEIDIESIKHHCGVLVVTPGEPVTNEIPDHDEVAELEHTVEELEKRVSDLEDELEAVTA